jgi:hypothetical protein
VKYNGVMCADISNGTEPFPVPALNSVDTSEWGKGMGFSYTPVVLPSRKAESLLAPVRCDKNASFFEFPYVCPEPVLVKCSFLYINGSKRRLS